MKIKLPYIDPIDTLNLHDNLEEQVRTSFEKFTSGTAEDYTFEDKLSYLDNLRGFLHPLNSEGGVRKIILDSAKFKLDEYGELPNVDEYNSIEFMEHCYEQGFKPYRDKYEEYSHSANTKTLKAIFRIINAIVNWEREKAGEQE